MHGTPSGNEWMGFINLSQDIDLVMEQLVHQLLQFCKGLQQVTASMIITRSMMLSISIRIYNYSMLYGQQTFQVWKS